MDSKIEALAAFIGSFFFWFFIAVKIAGTSLSDWSWWWLLMSPVPVLSLLVKHYGL